MALIDVSIICRYGRVNTARCLLDSIQGSYVINDVNSEGKTPLHLASESGHVKVVALLMQRGALLHRYGTPTNYFRYDSLTCSTLKQPEKHFYASYSQYCLIVICSFPGYMMLCGCNLRIVSFWGHDMKMTAYW